MKKRIKILSSKIKKQMKDYNIYTVIATEDLGDGQTAEITFDSYTEWKDGDVHSCGERTECEFEDNPKYGLKHKWPKRVPASNENVDRVMESLTSLHTKVDQLLKGTNSDTPSSFAADKENGSSPHDTTPEAQNDPVVASLDEEGSKPKDDTNLPF